MSQKYFELPEIGQLLIKKRKGMKNIKLRITQAGQVQITMPRWMPYLTAVNFANKQKQWIFKHKTNRQEFQHGADLPFNLKLHFEKSNVSRPVVKIKDDKLLIKIPEASSPLDNISQLAVIRGIKKLLILNAHILEDELIRLSNQYNLPFNSLKYKFMKSRWGSCSNKKDITLNYRLLELSYPLRHYVMIHELAHTIHMNHGQQFWSLVEELLPNYKVIKKQLKAERFNWL